MDLFAEHTVCTWLIIIGTAGAATLTGLLIDRCRSYLLHRTPRALRRRHSHRKRYMGGGIRH